MAWIKLAHHSDKWCGFMKVLNRRKSAISLPVERLSGSHYGVRLFVRSARDLQHLQVDIDGPSLTIYI